MKTLLFNPGPPRGRLAHFAADYPKNVPLGLAYIAAVLEKEHEIRVLDNNAERLTDSQIEERIRVEAPDVMAIGAMSTVFDEAVSAAKIAKGVDPKIKVVIGGAHVNNLPESPFEYDCFDYAVYGEGELTSIELWRRMERGEGAEGVKGVAFRKDGRAHVNERRELIHDLDTLPFPARKYFPFEKYERRELGIGTFPVDHVNTSRGCPFRCRFCSAKSILGKGYRLRSAGNMLDEIEIMRKEYGSKAIYFREDNFTANPQRVSEFCDEVKKRGMDFPWACESRVNTVNGELLSKMHDAGCRVMWFGVESGKQETLDWVCKDITLEQIRAAFKACRKIGIMTGASFIIGLPNETPDDIRRTVDFACELDPDSAWFNIFWAIPSSELYEYCREKGMVDEEIGNGIFTVKTEHFDRAKMEEMQREANRRFYSDPRRALRLGIRKLMSGELSGRTVVGGIKKVLGR